MRATKAHRHVRSTLAEVADIRGTIRESSSTLASDLAKLHGAEPAFSAATAYGIPADRFLRAICLHLGRLRVQELEQELEKVTTYDDLIENDFPTSLEESARRLSE